MLYALFLIAAMASAFVAGFTLAIGNYSQFSSCVFLTIVFLVITGCSVEAN